MLSEIELSLLKNVKEVKYCDIPLNSEFIGSIMREYGDEYYYKLPNGNVVYYYFSIGD